MNPILALVINSGIHYPPGLTSDVALNSILTALNNVGSGISAWVKHGIIMVETEDEDQFRIIVRESKVDIQGAETSLEKPIATLIAFATIHAIEQGT